MRGVHPQPGGSSPFPLPGKLAFLPTYPLTDSCLRKYWKAGRLSPLYQKHTKPDPQKRRWKSATTAEEIKTTASFQQPCLDFHHTLFLPSGSCYLQSPKKAMLFHKSAASQHPCHITPFSFGLVTKLTQKRENNYYQLIPCWGCQLLGDSHGFALKFILTSNSKRHFQAGFPSELPVHSRVFHTMQPHHLMLAGEAKTLRK